MKFTDREERMWKELDEQCDLFKAQLQAAFEQEHAHLRANALTAARIDCERAVEQMKGIVRYITEEVLIR